MPVVPTLVGTPGDLPPDGDKPQFPAEGQVLAFRLRSN
jgi:hypothetical protein